MESLGTTTLRELLTRYRAGDVSALDTILTRCRRRLERLASRMLANYHFLRQREQTDDILQGALVRLAGALREVEPASTRDFFGFAAEQMRRTLLDLVRYHRRRPVASLPATARETVDPGPGPVDEAADLERWTAFHEAIEKLPERERETFALAFYSGWRTSQIAELFEVSERQVRRWWASACLLLNDSLGGQLPGV